MCDNQATKELDNFMHFRNYYWGENRIKLRNEGGKKYSTLDLTFTAYLATSFTSYKPSY